MSEHSSQPALVEGAGPSSRGAIAAKLTAAIQACERPRQDKQHDRFNYKYTSADEVLRVSRKALAEAGLALIPELISDTVTEVGQTSRGVPIMRYESRYLMHLLDGEGNCLTVPARAEIEDSGAKGFAKNQTEALKSTCIALLMLSAASDPEGEAHEPRYRGSADVAAKSDTAEWSAHAILDRQGRDDQHEAHAERRARLQQMKATIRDRMTGVEASEWTDTIEELRAGVVDVPEWARAALEAQLQAAEEYGSEAREQIDQMLDEMVQATKIVELNKTASHWEQIVEGMVEPWKSHGAQLLDAAVESTREQIREAYAAESDAAEEAEEASK